jgi:hypothetical protein
MGAKAARIVAVSTVALLSTVLTVGQAEGSGGGEGSGGSGSLKPVVTGLDGPRGVAVSANGKKIIYSVTDGSVYQADADGLNKGVQKIGQVPGGFPPAIDTDAKGVTYALTGAGGEPGQPPTPGATTLYKLRAGKPAQVVADIAAYQKTDPDPYDLENNPTDSNPFGVAALKDRTVLVSDAAGNDLLRVWPNGKIKTVARIKPRVVKVPTGLPDKDPQGNPLPPAGTMLPSEGVATSVAVGSDGYYYLGELRGFPATPGTAEIWRIKPGSVGAVCDPANPYKGNCQRYADGYTSIVDLGAGPGKKLYVVELAKASWLQVELNGATEGALFVQYPGEHHRGGYKRELAKGKLSLPGGVGVGKHGDVYVSSPVFGTGSIAKVRH